MDGGVRGAGAASQQGRSIAMVRELSLALLPTLKVLLPLYLLRISDFFPREFTDERTSD